MAKKRQLPLGDELLDTRLGEARDANLAKEVNAKAAQPDLDAIQAERALKRTALAWAGSTKL